MIKYRAFNSDNAYNISKHYEPKWENFKSGIYIINDKEYTEWNEEFQEAVNKEKMWLRLQK